MEEACRRFTLIDIQMLLHFPKSFTLEYDEAGEVVRFPKDSEGNIK